MSCNCVKTPTSSSSLPIASSGITYDGGVLCIGISSGNVNQIITALSNAICTLQTEYSSLFPINDTQVRVTVVGSCFDFTAGTTLDQVITILMEAICGLTTELNNLSTAGVKVAGVTTNCLSITNGETLSSALVKIINKLCIRPNPIPEPEPLPIPIDLPLNAGDFRKNFAMDNPLAPFTLNPIILTTTSGLSISISSNKYYVDGQNIFKPVEAVTLTANSDNYIYIDNTTPTFDYAVESVPIGGTIPEVTGVVLFMQRTNVTHVTGALVQVIDDYPVSNKMLQDSCVSARNLSSDVTYSIGGLTKLSNQLAVNVDNSTLSITTDHNNLIVKDSGITRDKINSNVAGSGMIQNKDGSLSPSVLNSIVVLGDYVQLMNDTTPIANQIYSSNSGATRGWYDKDVIHALVVIPAATFKQLVTTPALLIASPETSGYVKVLDADIYVKYGSIAYTPNNISDVITICENGYVDPSSALFTFSNATITASADYIERGMINSSKKSLTKNAAIYLSATHNTITNGGGNYGNSVVYVNIWYKIITVA